MLNFSKVSFRKYRCTKLNKILREKNGARFREQKQFSRVLFTLVREWFRTRSSNFIFTAVLNRNRGECKNRSRSGDIISAKDNQLFAGYRLKGYTVSFCGLCANLISWLVFLQNRRIFGMWVSFYADRGILQICRRRFAFSFHEWRSCFMSDNVVVDWCDWSIDNVWYLQLLCEKWCEFLWFFICY